MSRSHRWTVPFLLVAMLLALGGPAAGTRAQDKITIRVWDQFTDPAESAAADAIYKGFTDAHPNITITREAISSDQMRQTINTAVGSGTGPDVIFYDAGPGYAGVLANAGLLSPLDQYAAQYGWTSKIAPQSLEATSLNGKLYGLPLQVDLIGMYYNQDLLTKEGWTAPKTVADLKTLCTEAKAKGYDPPLAFGDKEGWEAYHQFSMTTNAMLGPDAMRALLYNHQGSWNSPQVISALTTFFVDLKNAGCYTSDTNSLSYDDENSLFYTGQSILESTGSWQAANIQTNMPGANIGFMPFPALDGAKGQYWVSGVGSAYFITAKSAHQTEDAQFLDYLFSAPSVKQWIEKAGFYVPVQVDTSTLNVTPIYKTILDTLQTGIGPNATIQFGYNVDVLAPPQFNDAMTNDFQALIAGQKTPEQVAADLQAAWEQGIASSASVATPVAATPTS